MVDYGTCVDLDMFICLDSDGRNIGVAPVCENICYEEPCSGKILYWVITCLGYPDIYKYAPKFNTKDEAIQFYIKHYEDSDFDEDGEPIGLWDWINEVKNK